MVGGECVPSCVCFCVVPTHNFKFALGWCVGFMCPVVVVRV